MRRMARLRRRRRKKIPKRHVRSKKTIESVGDGEDAAAETNVRSKEKEERSGGGRDQQAQKRPAQVLCGTRFRLHFVGPGQVEAQRVNHEAEDPSCAVLPE